MTGEARVGSELRRLEHPDRVAERFNAKDRAVLSDPLPGCPGVVGDVEVGPVEEAVAVVVKGECRDCGVPGTRPRGDGRERRERRPRVVGGAHARSALVCALVDEQPVAVVNVEERDGVEPRGRVRSRRLADRTRRSGRRDPAEPQPRGEHHDQRGGLLRSRCTPVHHAAVLAPRGSAPLEPTTTTSWRSPASVARSGNDR